MSDNEVMSWRSLIKSRMVSAPELKQYMDKRVAVALNGRRAVTGTLRGYDVFLNVTLADALEKGDDAASLGTIVIRGNSIVSIEVCN